MSERVRKRTPPRAKLDQTPLQTVQCSDAQMDRSCQRLAGDAGLRLNGQKPGNLPVIQAQEFELFINRKTAGLLGVRLPQELLLRADEVIQQ